MKPDIPDTAGGNTTPLGPAAGELRLWVLCLLGLSIALLPYTTSGFYDDDLDNASIRGGVLSSGESIWSYIWTMHVHWMGLGRFFPVAVATGSLTWYLASAHLAARVMQIGFIVANVALCARLLRLMTGSRVVAVALVAMLPALFQVRNFHDPITSYSPLLQLVLLLLLVAVYNFLRFMADGRLWRLLLSLICHGAALATYEIGFATIFVLGCALLFRFGGSVKKGLLGFGWHALLVVGFAAVNVWLKLKSAMEYSGTELNVASDSLSAFAVQLTSAFPLNYVLLDPQRLFSPFPTPAPTAWALALLLFASTGGALWLALSRGTRSPRNPLLALSSGVALLVIPAVIVSISARHQAELTWGIGHLSVYMQLFGLAIAMSTAVCWLCALELRGVARWVQRAFLALVAVSVGATAAISFLANGYIVEYRNVAVRYPRDCIESAAKHGLFKNVPAGSVILQEAPRRWDTAEFYLQHTGKQLNPVTVAQWLTREPDQFHGSKVVGPSERVYLLRYEAGPHRSSPRWAMLSRLERLHFRKRGESVEVLDHTTRNPVCYVEDAQESWPGEMPIVAQGAQMLSYTVSSPVRINLSQPPFAKGMTTSRRRINLPRGQYLNLTVDARRDGERKPASFFLRRAVDSAALRPLTVSRDRVATDEERGEETLGVAYECDGAGEAVAFSGRIGSRVELRAPSHPQSLGLAFYLRRSAAQTRWAPVVSNHSSTFTGFTFEQVGGADAGEYGFGIGNGAGWTGVGRLSIPPDSWHLVIISVDAAQTAMRVVGAVGDKKFSVPAPPAAADDQHTIFLGNWRIGDRPFHGEIAHVVLADHPFDAQETSALIDEFNAWLRYSSH